MKIALKAALFLAILVILAWLLRPVLAPYINRAKQAEPVRVRQVNPLR